MEKQVWGLQVELEKVSCTAAAVPNLLHCCPCCSHSFFLSVYKLKASLVSGCHSHYRKVNSTPSWLLDSAIFRSHSEMVTNATPGLTASFVPCVQLCLYFVIFCFFIHTSLPLQLLFGLRKAGYTAYLCKVCHFQVPPHLSALQPNTNPADKLSSSIEMVLLTDPDDGRESKIIS